MVEAILYSGTRNASSWAMRAWLALREAAFDFEERVVDIRRPQRFANLAKIGTFSPPAAVPVLVVGDDVIFDSMAIMEFANELSSGKLLPADLRQRARARSILAWQHSGLSGICPRLSFESAFYRFKRAMTEREQADADRLFAHLEPVLRGSGGPYLFGSLSLADLALVPTVVRLLGNGVGLDRWPLVARWMRALLDRDSVRAWIEEAVALPPVWDDSYLLDGDSGSLAASDPLASLY